LTGAARAVRVHEAGLARGAFAGARIAHERRGQGRELVAAHRGAVALRRALARHGLVAEDGAAGIDPLAVRDAALGAHPLAADTRGALGAAPCGGAPRAEGQVAQL